MKRIAKKITDAFFSMLASAGTATAKAVEPIAKAPTLPPTEAVRVMPVRRYGERIIAGMGSGDSSDVNTYAMADRLGMRKGTPLPKMKDRTVTKVDLDGIGAAVAQQAEGEGMPINAGAIADVFDRAYDRDPDSKKMKLKDGLPEPGPNPDGKGT